MDLSIHTWRWRLKTMHKWNKKQWLSFICNNFLVIIGSLLLALGTAVFLTKLSIVSGGLSGIGIIVQHYYPNDMVVDIIVAVLSVILWIVGLIFCGKEFAFRTLISSIIYPILLSVFLRVEFFQRIATSIAGTGEVGNILICGLFAGVFIGAGVALTFLGKGSTGGVDVIIYLLAKYTRVRESIWSFVVDGTVILLSMILIPDNWINSLIGILSAFVTAVMIEMLYNNNMTSYQADIISDNWEEISRYAQDELGRGATIIRAEGGYKGEERIILRVVFEKRQYDKLVKFIAKVDPHAFVTYTRTRAVYGEGFTQHKSKKKS